MKKIPVNCYSDLATLLWPDKGISYRPIIVWAMNDALNRAELERQLASFKASGYGGVMVMPWGGLPYDFMCDEWVAFVRSILHVAQELSLDVWLWDEWLFGSGPAGGELTKTPEYRAKSLKVVMDFVVEPGESAEIIIPLRTVSAATFPVDKFGNPCGESFEPIDLNHGRPINIKAESRTRIAVIGWEYNSGMQHTTRSHAEFLNPDLSEAECDIRTTDDADVWSVDMMNPEAIDQYVELIHQRYWDAMSEFFGNTLKGFFYDEPKVPTRTPWTDDFAERFREIKGYDLLPYLTPIMVVCRMDGVDFTDILRPKDVRKVEADYRDVWTTLVADSFYGTIQAWCDKHEVIATGHPLGDNNLHEIFSNGGFYFKNMGYSDMPGVDSVGPWNPIIPGKFMDFTRFAGSIAFVLGKPRAMSESFAVYGHGTNLDHMRYVCEHQIMRGVNTFFCKLSNYNRRKSFYFHPPELSDYNTVIQHFGRPFCDRIGNIASLMSSGTATASVVALYIPASNYYTGDTGIADRLMAIAEKLTYNQVEYVYTHDSDILNMEKRDGVIVGGAGQSYSHVIIPTDAIVPPDVNRKLESFGPDTVCMLENQSLQTVITAYRKRSDQTLSSASADVKISMRTRTLKQGVQCCMLLNESVKTERIKLEVAKTASVFELDLNTWQVELLQESSTGTSLDIEFMPAESRILLFDTKGRLTSPSKRANHATEAVALEEWVLETPDGKSRTLGSLLPDWGELGFPGFTGFMRYRCKFTWDKEGGNAMLSLGELCYAATIFLDGCKIGDCVFTPFTLQLKNLSRGNHVLEIDVLNTSANAVFGDKARLKSLRSAQVFKGTYAPLYEKLDTAKLRSGLFGPVGLHIGNGI